MKIAIVDDDEPVRELFRTAILTAHHQPVPLVSVSHLRKYISDGGEPPSIIYLDNHFVGRNHNETMFGVDQVEDVRRVCSDSEIILTTQEMLRPADVPRIQQLKIGFLPKPSDMDDIIVDIAQRLGRREMEIARQAELLNKIRTSVSSGSEGILGFFRKMFRRPDSSLTAEVISVDRSPEQPIVIPNFSLFLTVHDGMEETHTIDLESEVRRVETFKACTNTGFGLSISDSAELFASELGIRIKHTISNNHSTSAYERFRAKYSVSRKYTVSESDIDRGVHSVEYYWAVLHDVWIVSLRGCCSACGDTDQITLRVFTPGDIVETSCGYDRAGRVVYDGRLAYRLISHLLL